MPVVLQTFRKKFVIPDRNLLRWFPGHMATGMKKMQSKLKSVDCVIEVHDARIPFSGRNPNFKRQILGVKPHILVLNKADLADKQQKSLIFDRLKRDEGIENVLYICSLKESDAGIDRLLPLVTDLVKSSSRYNRQTNSEHGVMVIGVPNVGKSSLINRIRSKFLKKGAVAQVGAKAGITRAVQTRITVSSYPPVFVYDTPGILTPDIPNVLVGMKLALCATLNDHNVGYITIADYLLFWCNRNKVFSYMDFFNIQEPCDDTNMLLANYAIKHNLYQKIRAVDGSGGVQVMPAISQAAQSFVDAFRLGRLGAVCLDQDMLD